MSHHGYHGLRTSKVALHELEEANEIHQFETIGMKEPVDGSTWMDPIKKTSMEALSMAGASSSRSKDWTVANSRSRNALLPVPSAPRASSPYKSQASTTSQSIDPNLSLGTVEPIVPIVLDDQSRPGSPERVPSRSVTHRSELATARTHTTHHDGDFEIPEYLRRDEDREHKDTFAPIERHLMDKPREYHDEPTVLELRNYLKGMDRFESTAFMIWQGVTMRDTPEFHSYKDRYSADWGGICTIIEALERLMKRFDIQLAIVNGVTVYTFAVTGQGTLDMEDLISCCLNGDAVRTATQSMEQANDQNQQFRAAILLQSLLRRWKAMRFFREQRERFQAVCAIQKRYRLHFYAKRLRARKELYLKKCTQKWEENVKLCESMWCSEYDHPSLLILIPAITAHDYIVRANHFYQEMHNVFYPLLHQLARPNCELCIIAPRNLTTFELQQVEKLLSVVCPGGGGKNRVDILKERTHFITPEMQSQVPKAVNAVQSMSLAEHLWYSPGALRKIRSLARRHGGSLLVPSSACPIHKELSIYLGIPLLSPDPELMAKIHTRSFSKRIIMKAGVDTPPGTHDVHTQDDVVTALSRLIAANMDVEKWALKLNGDLNNEGLCLIDTTELEIYEVLRKEMKTVLTMNRNNVGAWYSRPVQLSVRKRIAHELQERLPKGYAHIVRSDVFPTWVAFLRRLKKYGGIVEADPGLMRLGEMISVGFIAPHGRVTIQGTMDVLMDPRVHTGSGYLYPSLLANPAVSDGATTAVARVLWEEHKCFGFFSVRYLSHFDRFENRPRLWGLQVDLGLHPLYGALGLLRVATANTPGYSVPNSVISPPVAAPTPIIGEGDEDDLSGSDAEADLDAAAKPHAHHNELFPPLPETMTTHFPEALAVPVPLPPVLSSTHDRLRVARLAPHVLGEHPMGPRAMVYIPIVFHAPLDHFTDEGFHTACTQRGLIFNRSSRTGVLVLHVGGTKRGNFGIICFHETRLRVQELAIQAMSSIYEFVGKERKPDQVKKPPVNSVSETPARIGITVTSNAPPGGFHLRLIRTIGCLKTSFKHDMAVKLRGELSFEALAAAENMSMN